MDASQTPDVSRRQLLTLLGGIGITGTLARALAAQANNESGITAEMIRQAEWIAGIPLTDEQRIELAKNLEKNASDLAKIRALACDADVPPCMIFQPDFFSEPLPATRLANQQRAVKAIAPIAQSLHAAGEFPSDPLDIAFATVVEQAEWLAARKLSSLELTKLYLQRLEEHDPQLKCVVTLLGDSALEQAQASDSRRSQGASLGLLDGIPWVAKDLIAVPPWKTTWGARPYRDQVRPTMATVAERLQAGGGVLLAKVSLGALAWGDIWFGGTTRNPWQPDQGSSGSSAGTACAVAAGLASYGIGSETLGSIVSPCIRCCVSGLRPSYGRVSRFGCMPLAWSFDKLGPIARGVDDLAIVFSHIVGPDGRDPSVVHRPFEWPDRRPLSQFRVGTVGAKLQPAEEQALEWLVSKGVQRVEVELPTRFPLGAMTVMLNAEATAMFDDILRSDPNADLGLWPASFRKGQYVSAVQYIRASRLRTMLVQETEEALRGVDFLLGADDLTLTNLSGHPSLIVALGSEEPPGRAIRPATVKLTAAMYHESTLLSLGQALQTAFPRKPDRPASVV